MKRAVFIVALVSFSLLAFVAGAQDWKPTKPITIIVPWGAGGSTDQIVRLMAGVLEPKLGQKIVVVNQAGASGSDKSEITLSATDATPGYRAMELIPGEWRILVGAGWVANIAGNHFEAILYVGCGMIEPAPGVEGIIQNQGAHLTSAPDERFGQV